jgi:hypothetical protein
MTIFKPAAVLAAGIVAILLFAAPAWAVTPDEVAARYGTEYQIVSVTLSETDPSVYEMRVGTAEVNEVILVDAVTGDIVPAEEPEPTPGPGEGEVLDPADKDECKAGGWVDLGFRNQGQCVRFVNTEVDTRDGDDEEVAETEEEDERGGEECRNGGWEALGFRNQGACLGG